MSIEFSIESADLMEDFEDITCHKIFNSWTYINDQNLLATTIWISKLRRGMITAVINIMRCKKNNN